MDCSKDLRSKPLQLPFLAVSGAHGWTSTLNGVHRGIQINMRKLNSLQVNADGKTATVGGGVMQYEIPSGSLNTESKQVSMKLVPHTLAWRSL